MTNLTMTNIRRNSPWRVLFLFFTFFLFYREREGDPYFHWNFSIDKQDSCYFHWNNSICSKNKKEESTYNINPYINLFVWFCAKRGWEF